MKLYYYLLFRIYKYYTDYCKQDEKTAIISTSIISSFITIFSILTILLYFDNYVYSFIKTILPNKIITIFYIIFIALINHFVFIKNKKFLNYNFSKSKKGKLIVLLYFLFVIILFYRIVDIHTNKIFKEREKVRIENNQ